MHANEIMMMLFLQLCISPTASQREEGELVTDMHFVLKMSNSHFRRLQFSFQFASIGLAGMVLAFLEQYLENSRMQSV